MASRHSLVGLTAYERHKKFVHDYVTYYGGRIPSANEHVEHTKTDWEAVREQHKFLRTEEDDKPDSSWEAKLAKKYYDKLFKEYCLADLTLYKEGKIGMRWRTQKEVIAGKGQFICGNKKCDSRTGLASYEVNFGYREDGIAKQALVKLRVCPECASKLNYKKQMALSKKANKRKGEAMEGTQPGGKRQQQQNGRNDSGRAEATAGQSRGTADESSMAGEQPDKSGGAAEQPGGNQEIWRTKQPSSQDPSPEEEFDKYFQDMFM